MAAVGQTSSVDAVGSVAKPENCSDGASGLRGLLRAALSDCFAIPMTFGGEAHRSIYFRLFGKDLQRGETATARTRLVIGRKLDEEKAVAHYQEFLRGLSPDTPGELRRDAKERQ